MHNFTRSFLLSAAAMTCVAGLNAAETPEVSWGKLFDGATTAGDQNTTIQLGSSNEVYWLNTLGSTTAAQDLFFGGEKIFAGSEYTGTSYTNNLAVTKTDAAGNELWTIYSNSGDYSSQEGGMAVCADGSIIFAGKVRHGDGFTDQALNLVDATGADFNFGSAVETRYYNFVIAKASADGEIKWVRTIDVEHGASPDGSKDFVADAAYMKGVAVDKDGNIFVAGNFRMPLCFTKADNSTVTVSPRNSSAWNGNSQTSTGDLYLAKLDADGYYIDCLQAQGEGMTTEYILGLSAANDKIYFQGYAVSAQNATVTLGGKEIKATDVFSPFVGAVNPSDLSVEWLTSMLGEKVDNKNGYQNTNLNVVGNHMWLSGMFNLKITDASNAANTVKSQQGTQREGFIIKFDAENGAWLAAADSRDGFGDTGLGGYVGTIQNPSDNGKVYAFGYIMNASVGVFLRGYNAETLEADTEENWSIVTQGGVPSAVACAYDAAEGRAYVTARGNKAFLPMGGELSPAPTGWAVYAARFDLPEGLVSGVENVSIAPVSSAVVTSGAGYLAVTSESDTTVGVYDLAGRAVAFVKVAAGTTAEVQLPAGLYIAAGAKVIVK